MAEEKSQTPRDVPDVLTMTDERTRWRFHGTRHRNLGDQSFVSEFVLNVVSRALVRRRFQQKAKGRPGTRPFPVRQRRHLFAPPTKGLGSDAAPDFLDEFRSERFASVELKIPLSQNVSRNIANFKLFFLKNIVPLVLRRCLGAFSVFAVFHKLVLVPRTFQQHYQSYALRTTKTKCGFSTAFSV